jgi:hypothetical protein
MPIEKNYITFNNIELNRLQVYDIAQNYRILDNVSAVAPV